MGVAKSSLVQRNHSAETIPNIIDPECDFKNFCKQKVCYFSAAFGKATVTSAARSSERRAANQQARTGCCGMRGGNA